MIFDEKCEPVSRRCLRFRHVMGGIFENLSSHGISEISNRGIYIGVYRGDCHAGSWRTESLSCVRFFGGAFGSPLAMRVGVKEFALDQFALDG